MISGFCGGTSMSSTAIEMPALVASRKPFCSSLSANTTVSFRPHLRNEALISLEISFFFSALLMLENGRPLGRISDSSARPTVVSTSEVDGTNSPRVLVLVPLGQAHVDLGGEFDLRRRRSARCTSPMSAKIMPSPLALMRSRVV